MSLNSGMRSCARLLTTSEAFLPKAGINRRIHSTTVKKMGGHGHDEPEYMHAYHMYNLEKMKHQTLKVTLATLTAFSIGVFVPVYAVIFQQKKAKSG